MTKGKYVDGYVFTVPKKHVAAYKKICNEAAKMWVKCGALEYKECMGDDLKQHAAVTGPAFPKLVGQKASETVWLAFVVYKNRKHRDQVNKKVMAEFAKQYPNMEMPAFMQTIRMTMGGFTVEAGS